MSAAPMAAELARARRALREAEDEIRDLRAKLARRTVDVSLPEQRQMDNQIDNQLHEAEVVDLTPVMTPEQQARFDADHADGPTPGCDCGHDGMGRAWHARDCAWRAGLRDVANPA